jgi:hypothetical protein
MFGLMHRAHFDPNVDSNYSPMWDLQSCIYPLLQYSPLILTKGDQTRPDQTSVEMAVRQKNLASLPRLE